MGIKDVAARAGVSIATVSNVLNGRRRVSAEVEERIYEAVEALNYRSNPLAKGLKSSRTNVIAVIVPKITSVYFLSVLDGIERVAQRENFKLVYYNTENHMQTEREMLDLACSAWVDGIILDSCVNYEDEREYAAFLSKLSANTRKIPVVSLERAMDERLISSITVNNYRWGLALMEHLLECGCRHIVHIPGPIHYSMSQELLRAYRESLEIAGLAYDERFVPHGGYSTNSGYVRMKELLALGETIDGVFSANDQIAIGAIEAIRSTGRVVPHDIKITGLDGVFVGTLIQPALTTVDVPRDKMGELAAQMIIDAVQNRSKQPQNIMLDCTLVVRGSTNPAVTTHWDLLNW